MGEIETVDQDRIDACIWRNIGIKTVREISELAGIKPEEVLRRKNELLEGVDVLTIQQKRQRLLIELDGMARDARDRAKNASDEFYAGTVNASAGAIKTMLSELARIEKQDSGKIEALNQLRIRELLSIVNDAVITSVKTLSIRYKLSEEDMMGVFQEHLIDAAQKRENPLVQ